MCQAVRDGGRRCPVHRHSTKGLVKAVHTLNPGMNKLQVEKLFTELRREGRDSTVTQEEFETFRDHYLEELNIPAAERAEVDRQFGLAEQHDTELDSATMYAFMSLPTRAQDRSAALTAFLESVANRTGYTVNEVRQSFTERMASVETGRGSSEPAEYDQNTRRRAVRANLPYDRASVVAIEQLRNLNPTDRYDTVPRITHEHAGRGRTIDTWGYHNGRLEVKFRNTEDVFAYHNVPESVWERMQANEYPNVAFNRYIRNRAEYAYASQEEADADSTAYRCGSCGQFRSLDAHDCPALAERVRLASEGLTMAEIDARLALSHPGSPSLAEVRAALPAGSVQHEMNPHHPTTVALRGETALPQVDERGLTAHRSSDINYEDERYFTRDRVAAMEQPDVSQILQATIGRSNAGAGRVDFALNSETRLHFSNPGGSFENEGDYQKLDEFFSQGRANNIAPAALIANLPNGTSRILAMYSTRDFYLTFDHPDRHRTTAPRTASLNAVQHGYDAAAANVSAATAAQEQEAFAAAWDADRDDMVTLSRTTQPNSRVFLSGFGYNVQASKIAGRSALQEAYSSGKAVRTPVELTYDTDSRAVRGSIDYSAVSDRGTVVADTVSRMNTAGEVEVIARTLKCSCATYQRNYHCVHVSQAAYDIPVALQRRAKVLPHIPGVSNPEGATYYRYSSELNEYMITPRPSQRMREIPGDPVDNSATIERARELVASEMTVPAEDMDASDRQALLAISNGTLPRYTYPGGFSSIVSNYALDEQERSAIKGSNAEIPVSVNYITSGYRQELRGRIMVRPGSTEEQLNTTKRELQCTCPDYRETYDCVHVRDFIANESRYVFLPENSPVGATGENEPENLSALTNDIYRTHSEAVTLESSIQRALSGGITYEEAERRTISQLIRERDRERQRQMALAERAAAYESYRTSRETAWEETAPAIADNLPAFQETVADLTRRRQRGEQILEMQYENVTDGVCAPGTHTRSFGVEIEFDVPDNLNRREVLNRIGQELYEAGLTEESYQQHYHASHGEWSRWSFEEDCTVAGEIVSPIMKDTPEDWRELEQVIDIVNRNGGVASTRAGSHVHVSSGSFNMTRAPHAELTRLVRQDEDTVFRLASNPARGTHRGPRWCSPNISVAEENIPPSDTDEYGAGVSGGHGSMLNYEGSVHTRNPDSAHVEFRMWDGTLNAAVIQQQVAISAAYVDLAERNVRASGGHYVQNSDIQYRRLGDAVRANAGPVGDQTPEQFETTHRPVAEMFDRLFRTQEQRDQVTRLYALTNDQENINR